MFVFAPPALVQSQPASPKLFHALSEALEGAPEALTDRRPARVQAEAAKAVDLWDRNRGAVLAALTADDRDPFTKTLERLRTTQGDEAGFAALNAMAILEHNLPAGRPQWLAAADRLGMQAWIILGEGKTDIPDLAAAFKPLIDQDGGGHVAAVKQTRSELDRYQAALSRKEFPAAQKAVGILLDLVDAFEKPASR